MARIGKRYRDQRVEEAHANFKEDIYRLAENPDNFGKRITIYPNTDICLSKIEEQYHAEIIYTFQAASWSEAIIFDNITALYPDIPILTTPSRRVPTPEPYRSRVLWRTTRIKRTQALIAKADKVIWHDHIWLCELHINPLLHHFHHHRSILEV